VRHFLSTRSERTFRKLYRHHTPRLYQLVLRLLRGNESEAREVVQDTWVRAVERLPGFRWQSSLHTWLTGIAVRRCQEQFRQRKRTQNHTSLKAESSCENPVGSEDRLDLETAIAQLADGYRQVLVLHDIEGYTHEEIAAMLGIQAGTSKSQLFQARKQVRVRLRDVPEKEN